MGSRQLKIIDLLSTNDQSNVFLAVDVAVGLLDALLRGSLKSGWIIFGMNNLLLRKNVEAD